MENIFHILEKKISEDIILNGYAQEELFETNIFSKQTPDSLWGSAYSSSSCAKNYLGVLYMLSKEETIDFENYLLLNKGHQEVTRKGYSTAIKIVLKRLSDKNPNHSEFKNHILWMHSEKYSFSHITNTSLAIEHYTTYKENPLYIARTKKPQPIIKNCLSEAEVNTIIRNVKNIREKAMIMLLAYSGVRNKEFCNIKVNDLDLGCNTLKIINGKNRKDRVINISSICSNVLREYLDEYKKRDDNFLFTTLKENNQYKTNDLRKLVKVLTRRSKLNKRVYPHLFRHSLATNLLKRGANLMTIKEQLGHSFIETTMIYLTSSPQRIKSEYEYYCPAYA